MDTYTIIKYQLLDIKIAFQKSFVYSVLVAVITATYFIFVFLAERLFQGMVGYTSLVVSIIYAFVIALFFNPVKNVIQRIADKIFLGKDPIQIARENELMRQELERSERLKSIAAFASGMAHEIKNPLTAIKTFSEYLPAKKDDPEFLSKFSSIVSKEVNRIDSLVHQLLDFSKPTPLELQDIDIHRLLDETLGFLNSEFIKHGIKVEKNYCVDANDRELAPSEIEGANANSREYISDDSRLISANSRIKGDSNQLKQAFLNLFLNAIEAMPQGGTLTVQTIVHGQQSTEKSTDKAMDYGLSTNKPAMDHGPSTIKLIISDTGTGINPKDLPHIFEPFFTKKEKGTGLGLSIVYNILKEHSGSVKVESKIGEGTKFIIEVPLTK